MSPICLRCHKPIERLESAHQGWLCRGCVLFFKKSGPEPQPRGLRGAAGTLNEHVLTMSLPEDSPG